MEIQKALEYYGFDEKEITLYLCLLKHTELSVFEIAKQTGIPRTTTYATLESLKKQGIVSSNKKNGVVHYTPENPKQLLFILKEKEQKIEQVIPAMMNLVNSAGKIPKAELFLGEEGIKHVFEDILITLETEDVPVLYAFSQVDLLEVFPRFMPEWIERRHKIKKTFTKMLVQENESGSIPKVYDNRETRETRLFPSKFLFDCTFDMYGTKTALFYLKGEEQYAVLIDSKAVTDTFKQFFLFAWETIGEKE